MACLNIQESSDSSKSSNKESPGNTAVTHYKQWVIKGVLFVHVRTQTEQKKKDQQRKNMNQNSMALMWLLNSMLICLKNRQKRLQWHQCSKCFQTFIETLPVIFKTNLSQYFEIWPPLWVRILVYSRRISGLSDFKKIYFF